MFRLLIFAILLLHVFSLVQIEWGIAYPIDAQFMPMTRRGIDLAVKKINEEQQLPGAEIVLKTVPIEILMTKVEKMKTVAESKLYNPKMSALLGFATSRQVADPNAVSAIFKIPMLSSAATSPEFSNKEEFPYFGRVICSSYNIGLANGDLAQISHFRRAAHLGSTTYSVGRVEPIKVAFEDAGIQFIGSTLHDTFVDESVETVMQQMDEILLHYKELGVNIITYTSQHEEGQLVLWRAYKLGMLGPQPDGTVYQWMVADDMSGTHAFEDDCEYPECAAEMKYVREAAKGLIAFETNYSVDQDWYENVWLPNVGPETLSEEEIEISKTNDWDNDFNTRVVLGYDMPTFLVAVI